MTPMQGYYGPPLRAVTTANHIHRSTEYVLQPSVPTQSEAEVNWHLRMPLPPVHSLSMFFPLGSFTRIDVRSGRRLDDRRAYGVAMSLAKCGYGIANADARVLNRWVEAKRRTQIELWCQFPGTRQPVWPQAPSPIKITHNSGSVYTLGELVSVIASMYKRFMRTGAAHPQCGALQRANNTAWQFEHVRLISLHLGHGQFEGWCIPEIVLVDRDPPA